MRTTPVGITPIRPHRNLPVSRFGRHDDPVDQHASHQDQREQDDDVHRHAHHVQDADANEKRSRNGKADKCRVADSQHCQHNHHDDDHSGGDIVAKVAQHIANVL